MKKLVNKAHGMEIGAMVYDHRIRLYVREGQELRFFAVCNDWKLATAFLEKIKKWDEAGGNDGEE